MQSIYLHSASTNHGDSIVGRPCLFSFYLTLFSLWLVEPHRFRFTVTFDSETRKLSLDAGSLPVRIACERTNERTKNREAQEVEERERKGRAGRKLMKESKKREKGQIGKTNECRAQSADGFVRRRERKHAVQFVRMFSNIGVLHSSRAGSLDKRTKGQLFGGRKDSWSSRPQRHDALGRSGYFPATAHRLKIESSPAKVRQGLPFESTIRSPREMLDIFRFFSTCPECLFTRETPVYACTCVRMHAYTYIRTYVSHRACNRICCKLYKGFRERIQGERRYTRIYTSIGIFDIYSWVLSCAGKRDQKQNQN